MKKGLKKFLAMGLATVLAVGSLAGCGEKTESDKKASTKSGSAATSTGSSTSGVALNDAGTYPMVSLSCLYLHSVCLMYRILKQMTSLNF